MNLQSTLSRLVAAASLCCLATLGAAPAQAQNDAKPMAKSEAAPAAKPAKAAASKPTRAERQAARSKRNAEMKDAVKKGDVQPVKP